MCHNEIIICHKKSKYVIRDVILCSFYLTSWTTTHLSGVSAPPTMVTPRLAEVRGISTWDTSPSRMGSRVMPAMTITINYNNRI